MNDSRCLFWHRRDLRITDNLGLNKANDESNAITGIYIIDPKILYPKKNSLKISKAKIWFTLNSLIELHHNWELTGSRLLIMRGDPINLIPLLAEILKVSKIFWNENLEPYEVIRDKKVASKLEKQKIKVSKSWDQLLIEPNQNRTISNDAYRVFGAFYKKWDQNILLNQNKIISSYRSPKKLIDVNEIDLSKIRKVFIDSLIKNPKEEIKQIINHLNFKNSVLCPCRPGEAEAKKQLNYFISRRLINNYEKGRDIPSLNGTSQLSAALNVGTLSCRDAWNSTQIALRISESEEEFQSIRTWMKELVWREFYQNAILNFPELETGAYRSKWKKFPWMNSKEYFNSWQNGLTGFPIIDAAMRELNTTSWMHNRCRMIVASFLVKDLICSWQWGERVFMDRLVDGDLAANNGGWQWSASSGMDTKPLRIFNPTRQARRFDPEAKYIRHWLPELRHVSTTELITGEINTYERKGYPEPLVNHQEQQAKFKLIYATLSNSASTE